MLQLIKTEFSYHRWLIIASLLVSLAFSVLFWLFEPPRYEIALGLLFIGPMVFGGIIAIMRAKEQRDNHLLLMPVSHLQVFLARLVLFAILVFTPYIFGTAAFALRGELSESMQMLVVPGIAKGLITLVVFQIQMDVGLKRLTELQGVLTALFIGLSYVMIIWALIFYESMNELLTDLGAGFIVRIVLQPIHENFNSPLAILIAAAFIGVNYYVFTLERDYKQTRVW